MRTKRSVFDLYPEKYDNWFERCRHAYLSELFALQRVIPRGDKRIEIGIGSARFAQMLDIEYGIDISMEMLKLAKSRGCKVVLADAGRLPFRMNEFDSALLTVTLCFVKHPEKVIKETKRILNNGGTIVIGMIDKNSALGRLYRKKDSVFYKSAHFLSTGTVVNFLKNNGFHGIKTLQTLFEEPESMSAIDRITEGHGKGGFVVIAAKKVR